MGPVHGPQPRHMGIDGEVFEEAPPPYHEAVASTSNQAKHGNLDALFDQAFDEIEAEQPSHAELSREPDAAEFQIEIVQ